MKLAPISKTDKIGIFVGNLPYNYDEKEIGRFLPNTVLPISRWLETLTGLPKGFAFIETADPRDAEKMIDEMHHFNTDEERRLTVRLATARAAKWRRRRPRGQVWGEKDIWQKRELLDCHLPSDRCKMGSVAL